VAAISGHRNGNGQHRLPAADGGFLPVITPQNPTMTSVASHFAFAFVNDDGRSCNDGRSRDNGSVRLE